MKLHSIGNTLATAFSTRNVSRAATTVKHAFKDGLSALQRKAGTPPPTSSSLPPRRSIPTGTSHAAWQRHTPQVPMPTRQKPVNRGPIPVPRNAMEEDQQLRAALEQSLVDVAIRASLNESRRQPASSSNWYGQQQQPAHQEPIPAPRNAWEENQQLQAALEASLRQPQPHAAPGSHRYGQQHQPVHQESIRAPSNAWEENQQLQAALEASLVDIAIQASLNEPRFGPRQQGVQNLQRNSGSSSPSGLLGEAINLLTVPEQTLDWSEITGRHTMNVVHHLQDLATRHSGELHPAVHQALERSQGDPEELILNLLELVTARNPVLSRRPTSSVQPPLEQESISLSEGEMDEDQQLKAALNASLADVQGASQIPPNWREMPMYRELNIENVPNDGNCFFHSIIQLAGPRIAQELGIAPQALQPKHIRQHVVSTVIDQLIECEKGGTSAEALMQSYPYLRHMQVPDSESEIMFELHGSEALAFKQVLGRDADRCQHMTPTTLTNLYHLAKDRSWNNLSGDFFAPATAAAFPGLRIAVVTPHAELTFGEGEENPQLLVLLGAHFMPATRRA